MKIFLFLLFGLSTVLGTAQSTYVLAKESELSIDGTSTVHDWTVTANEMTGTMKVAANAPKEINFQVAVANIKSERGATMDKKMHAALKEETEPHVIFDLKSVLKKNAVVGSLSIAGTIQEVEIPCELHTDDQGFKISGQYGIALKDYNIEPPTAMFGQVVVGPEVTVKFDLRFEKL